MSVESWDFFFIHFCGRGSHFPQGHLGITEECTNLEFSDSVLFFVRGAIWHQEVPFPEVRIRKGTESGLTA